MKEFELDIRDVIYTPAELYADWKSIAGHVTQQGDWLNFTLPDRGQPHMFAMYLWAIDSTQESGNFRIARRFVLVDNTSKILISENHPITAISASPAASFEWQIKLIPIILDWTNHFYNSWHVHTNLLLPIREETNTSHPIEGVFEQETGDLPVSGTPNVHGLVNFMYQYNKTSIHGDEVTQFLDVPNTLSQKLSLHETKIEDGDIMEITIKAIDIMNNTNQDRITLYIDSSPPIIEKIYLVKDGYRYIFVHNETDLSKMNMVFTSYDVHR